MNHLINNITDMAYDVFISYSNIDKDVADSVCSILEENGIRCWIAPRDITPGIAFAEAIIDAIKSSKVFVLVYSSNSNHSPQVIKEVDRAVHHGLSIINLRLDDVPLSKKLEYYISDVHWLDAMTPPLEQHLKKLCGVVQMLLTMEKVEGKDIAEALRKETFEQEKMAKPGRKLILRRLLIPAAAIFLVFIILGAIRFFKRQADIRWAREEAIPQIEQMIADNDVWRNLVESYRLAERAEAILGNEPELEKLFSQCSRHIDVITEPPGASVYIKEYVNPDTEWTFLGITPLDSVRVPIGIFRWKLEKEGYDTVFAAASTWDVKIGGADIIFGYNLIRTMDKEGSLPEGMVRVPGTETGVGPLGDFFIGRYEVTNREYKEFIDAGGYRNREYWKNFFIKDGRGLTWDEAMNKFVDQSGRPGPFTWIGGDYPQGEGDYPVSGISWYEAAAYAEWRGMSLPTSVHWDVARGAYTPMIQYPQLGGFGIFARFTNFGGNGPVAVGSLPGITAYGSFDMPGNVREWCWNETAQGRILRGGSWEDNTYEFEYERQSPPLDRSPRNGFRLALYPDSAAMPREVFGFRTVSNIPFHSKPQISDAVFRVYKEQFAYDPGELNPAIEMREENPQGWIHECVSFNASYGKERVLAHLFLPVNSQPPFQTVIYFPGNVPYWTPSSEGIEDYYEFPMFLSYLIRNGRAVLFPVYKGTFERGGPEYAALLQTVEASNSYAFTELAIQEIKDIRRSIDYLQTRQDIDSQKIAYMGMCWGGEFGLVITAVEERFKASVLIAVGFSDFGHPEVNALNYVTRVRTPTLMLNGKYDVLCPPEISAIPAFDLLGTLSQDKQIIFYETDHIPPRTEYIKETLAWLDKYLGPVR